MKCDSVDHFPDSSTRVEHRLTNLWRAAQRGVAGQIALAALLVLPVPALAAAEDPPAAPQAPAPAEVPPPPEAAPVPPPQVIEAGSAPRDGENGAPGPSQMTVEQWPTGAEASAPPPQDSPPKAPPVDGQWVYTSQYGWVWMPYSESYTYVPSDGYPAMYLYGPSFGWRWVAAPWIFDYGPTPYWGNRGRASFVWYSRPWFAHRAYVGPRYYYGPRYYGGGGHYYGGGHYSGGPRGGGYVRGGGGGGRREVVVHGSGGGGHSHGGGGHGHR